MVRMAVAFLQACGRCGSEAPSPKLGSGKRGRSTQADSPGHRRLFLRRQELHPAVAKRLSSVLFRILIRACAAVTWDNSGTPCARQETGERQVEDKLAAALFAWRDAGDRGGHGSGHFSAAQGRNSPPDTGERQSSGLSASSGPYLYADRDFAPSGPTRATSSQS